MATSQFDNENFAPRTEEERDILRKKVQKETEERYLKDREKALKLLEPRLELLQAFNEGKTIQAFFENAWRDLYMGTFPSSWLFPIDTYRVKDTSTSDNFFRIPNPKFKVGDKLKNKYSSFEVENCLYDYEEKIWKYAYADYEWIIYSEPDLELVEEKNETKS